MLSKELFLRIYDAASMQRWNDQVRAVELAELDKQAHKMVTAYVLGKCEEDCRTEEIDWVRIIESGLFEFLQRIILTDLKPPLFHKIKEDKEKYKKLNQWVYERARPLILSLGEEFCGRFKDYLDDTDRDVNRSIISAAHFYATRWEFNIIKQANPKGYLIKEIEDDLRMKQKRYKSLKGMQRFLSSPKLEEFVDICGQLRFQVRWSHLHRVPKTSVLGHMLIVAMLSYLFSLQIKADKKRCVINYFTSLFHDLPEVLTRDIINPVKRSVEGLGDLIKEYERKEMDRRIYNLLPGQWHACMRMFTEDEFEDIVSPGGEIQRDGKLIKAVDDLAAFIEADLALKNGIQNNDLKSAKDAVRQKYRLRVISGVNFEEIYKDFE